MRGALWLCVVVVAAAVWCGGLVEGQSNGCFPNERGAQLLRSFPNDVETFGFQLFRNLSSASRDSIFISPYSIWSVLTLAYLGSAGNTRLEMETAMNFLNKPTIYMNWNALKLVLEQRTTGPSLRITNRAYFSDSLVINQCLTNTLFDIKSVDFTNSQEAKRLINQEVNATTEGRIPELIKFLTPMTRFALVNAVFFKGDWETKFDPEKTSPNHEFLKSPTTSSKSVHMMFETGTFRQGFSEELDAQMLELPYANSTISMFVFLPKKFSTASIMENLSPENFKKAYNATVNLYTRVGLPRFRLNTRLEDELKDTLINQMGMNDLFSPRFANLTDFTSTQPPLSVDTAIHQATVEVTEEGTVAAAATTLLNTRFGTSPVNFVCNRPFVFLITDKSSGITLFAGEVLDSKDLEEIPV